MSLCDDTTGTYRIFASKDKFLFFVQLTIVAIQLSVLIIPFNVGLKRDGIPWASGTQIAIVLQVAAIFISLFAVYILCERVFPNWELSWSKWFEFGVSFYVFQFYIGAQILNLVLIHCQRTTTHTQTAFSKRYRYSLPIDVLL